MQNTTSRLASGTRDRVSARVLLARHGRPLGIRPTSYQPRHAAGGAR